MGSRQRQDLLGNWEHGNRGRGLKGKREGEEQRKMQSSIKSIKKEMVGKSLMRYRILTQLQSVSLIKHYFSTKLHNNNQLIL